MPSFDVWRFEYSLDVGCWDLNSIMRNALAHPARVLSFTVLALVCLAVPLALRGSDHYKIKVLNNSGTNANDLHMDFFGPYSNLVVKAFVTGFRETNYGTNFIFETEDTVSWHFTNGVVSNGVTTTIEWDAPSKDSMPSFGYWTLNDHYLTNIEGEVSFDFRENSNQTYAVAIVNMDTNAHAFSNLALYTGVPETNYDSVDFDNPAGGQAVPATTGGTLPPGGSKMVATFTPASAGYNLVSASISVHGDIYYTAFAFQPYPELLSPAVADGQFSVDLECPPLPTGYAILEESTDLMHWYPMDTGIVSNGFTHFMEPLGGPSQFYRAQLSW
jgi:hypothetical protein